MNSIFAIAKYTIIEQIRNRLYLIILFFGALILFSTLLLGTLAPGHKAKVVLDVGLLAIELFGLVAAVFGAVNLVLQEMESKTIYLILTRPIYRSSYLIGRFLGLTVAVLLTMLAMSLFHVLALVSDPESFRIFIYGTNFWSSYPLLVLASGLKMVITTALAVFFSLFATSSVSALVFTSVSWIVGHFMPEIAYLIKRSFHGFGQVFIHAIVALLPNYQLLNFRDFYQMPGFDPGLQLLWGGLYCLGYSTFFLALSSWLFSRKEF